MLVGKLDRCPNCGKWSIVRRATRQALLESEAAAAGEAQTSGDGFSRAASLRERELEDSRFIDE